MDDLLNSLKVYLYERLVSPLAGAFLISWTVWNYRFFFLVLKSGTMSIENFFYHVDLLFSSSDLRVQWDIYNDSIYVNFVVSGKLVDGFLLPLFFTFFYLYFYPKIAEPVYQLNIKNKEKLRKIKQKEEGDRLLSIHESVRIIRSIAKVEEEHASEISKYQSKLASQSEEIEMLRRNQVEQVVNEGAEIKLFDENDKLYMVFRKALLSIPHGAFKYTDVMFKIDLDSLDEGEIIAAPRRFHEMVNAGFFPGVKFNEVNTEDERTYTKNSRILKEDEENVLESLSGLDNNFGLSDKDVSKYLGINIEYVRVLLTDLKGDGYIKKLGSDSDGTTILYELSGKGRKYIVENKIIPL